MLNPNLLHGEVQKHPVIRQAASSKIADIRCPSGICGSDAKIQVLIH